MGGVVGSELNALAEKYYPDNGTRKPISYFAEYERILAETRNSPLRILELGVSSGASLLIWHDYLPRAAIVGIDIGEKPAVLEGLERIQFRQASQDDLAALDAVGRAYGPFDLIIDDASHIGYLTKRSFSHLFPHWLKPGGYYVIEDFGTGYLPEYPDGHRLEAPPDDAFETTSVFESHQYGMAGVVKQLIDYMMYELTLGCVSPIGVERLTILTNIAFVQKSTEVRQRPSLASVSAARRQVPPPPPPPDFGPDIERLNEALASLSTELSDLAANRLEHQDRLSEHERRLSEQEVRLAGQEVRLTGNDDRRVEHEGRLQLIEAKLERLRRALRPFRWLSRLVR